MRLHRLVRKRFAFFAGDHRRHPTQEPFLELLSPLEAVTSHRSPRRLANLEGAPAFYLGMGSGSAISDSMVYRDSLFGPETGLEIGFELKLERFASAVDQRFGGG